MPSSPNWPRSKSALAPNRSEGSFWAFAPRALPPESSLPHMNKTVPRLAGPSSCEADWTL